MVVDINVANLGNKLPDGRTLTAAIALRDSLTQRHSLLGPLRTREGQRNKLTTQPITLHTSTRIIHTAPPHADGAPPLH